MLLRLLLLVDHGKEEQKEENVSLGRFSQVFGDFCFSILFLSVLSRRSR